MIHHNSIKYLYAGLGIAGLLSVSIAYADLQSLAPQSPTPPTVSPVTVPSPLGCYDFTANLRVGAKGTAVRYLQYFLMKDGFNIPQEEFGVFSGATLNGVKGFQEKYASEILTPVGLTRGNGYVGKGTRAKLNSLYSCTVASVTQVIQGYTLNTPAQTSSSNSPANIAISNLTLDSNGVGVTVCNKGVSDLTTVPVRIRLNGINRDFEVTGAQKAGACDTESVLYGAWGLTYDPGAIFTAVTIIDPNAYYKTTSTQYPLNATTALTVPTLPGAHLSVRSVIIKTTGIQATLCNLGSADLTSFPVRVTVNGTSKDFDASTVYKKATCAPLNWTYDNFGASYSPATSYKVTVQVDPNNVINEVNEFDNTATAIGTP